MDWSRRSPRRRGTAAFAAQSSVIRASELDRVISMSDKQPSGFQVQLTLVDDQGDGVRFFSDLCQMIERIAARSGLDLGPTDGSDLQTPRSRTYVFASGLPEGVAREAGAHRAQLVPSGNAGRVMTSRVLIAVA